MRKILLGIILLFLVSCSDTTPKKILQLKVGMTEEQVIQTLGEPYTKVYTSNYHELRYQYRDNGYRHYLYVYIEGDRVDDWR